LRADAITAAQDPAIQAQFQRAWQVHAPNRGNCTLVADEVQRQNPGSQRIDMFPPGRAQTLDRWDGSGKPWGHHSAAELPGGRVLDPDQNMAFNNRDDWARAHVATPPTILPRARV
jgi:hypothetical protein